MKKIIITGVTGQDGSNMVDYLLTNTQDTFMYVTVRRLSITNHENIEKQVRAHPDRIKMVRMDLTDSISIHNLIRDVKPDYFINFAAQSFVLESWTTPVNTFECNTMAVLHMLEAIRLHHPECRFYSAGSSEEFGDVAYIPQDMKHPLRPRSPYGASKCAARHLVKVYRESYGLYAIHCILFNHEGKRRGKEFVTRKITSNLARIKHEILRGEKPTPFGLGNIMAQRDWSDSEDFVRAVWLMLNQEEPKEYLLASGEMHTIKEFIDTVCAEAKLDVQWEINEEDPLQTRLFIGKDVAIYIDEENFRPAEVDVLIGDPSESYKALNFSIEIGFEELAKKMYNNDFAILDK